MVLGVPTYVQRERYIRHIFHKLIFFYLVVIILKIKKGMGIGVEILHNSVTVCEECVFLPLHMCSATFWKYCYWFSQPDMFCVSITIFFISDVFFFCCSEFKWTIDGCEIQFPKKKLLLEQVFPLKTYYNYHTMAEPQLLKIFSQWFNVT